MVLFPGRLFREDGAHLRLGLNLEANALLYIADSKISSRNGLKVTIKHYDSGVTAIGGMLKGEVDVAMPSEFGVVSYVLKRKTSHYGLYDKVQLLLSSERTDGIRDISGPQGEKDRSSPKYQCRVLSRSIFELNRMSLRDVNLEDVKLPQLMEAIISGEIDAVVLWEPYRSQVENRLRDKVIVWPAQSSQPAYCVTVAGRDWLSKHPQTAERFLNALTQAEKYLDRHPAEAKAYRTTKIEI